ncbi:MAG: glycoside hydrolase family 57 protein [Spirochaetota bacterium]|nr:glycoside hydrolase family 57 protein [Spirochaetota bacterium]
MVSVCFYFQVHQPFRLKKNYSFFDIGVNHFYEDDDANREICNKVSRKCYIPANKMMLRLIDKFKGKFKISYSVSGIALEQFEKYNPEVIELFQKLASTGCVEFISETYYHSLSFLYSKKEFKSEIIKHRKRIRELFKQTPTTFRNTELIYNNELAKFIEEMGFNTILADGADQIMGWRSPNFVYQPKGCCYLNLLIKNYKLSDDIAFRFSNRSWSEYPLTADRFAHWLHQANGNGQIINLFMDYETFGEHQWEDTGIFQFFQSLPKEVLKHPDFQFINPFEAQEYYSPVSELDVPYYISWADMERDLSAWIGNPLQNSAIEMAFKLEEEVLSTNNADLLDVWRKLLTSDHFYYMCTKWFSDGDVHKYFNPFNSPYDAYIVYMNILNDLKTSIKNSRLYNNQKEIGLRNENFSIRKVRARPAL